MSIVKLKKEEIPNAIPLFKAIPWGWDVMVEAAKDFGFFLADNNYQPKVALAFMGGCIIYGGDAEHPNARVLVEAMEVQPMILPHPPEWSALVREVFGEKVKEERRYFLPFSSLDTDKLPNLPLPRQYQLKMIDNDAASRLKDELGEEFHIHHYSSLDDFVERGCGFCICRGREICAAAMAGLRGGDAIQIQINTKEQFRRQGLASQVGAALLRFCRENGIRADWDAANPASRELALKLGYTQCIPYEIMSVLPE